MIQLAHRIVLTEACNKACPHCFNADQRNAKHMNTEKLFAFWMENMPYGWLKNSELKIMGGEPTLHPEFLSVADLAIQLFGHISLFTNGTNLQYVTHPDILAAHWGDKFQFIINGYTFDFDLWRAWGKYYKKMQLHFVVPDFSASRKEMVTKIKFLAKVIAPVQTHFILSGDTQVNIFDTVKLLDYRWNYIEAMKAIIPLLREYGHTYSFDHTFPQCFWTQEMITELAEADIEPVHLMRQSCCDTILGLMDTNFDIWYCNQTRLKVGNAFVNGKPRQIEEILRMLRDMPCKKCAELIGKCRECPAQITCKSACWYKHAS